MHDEMAGGPLGGGSGAGSQNPRNGKGGGVGVGAGTAGGARGNNKGYNSGYQHTELPFRLSPVEHEVCHLRLDRKTGKEVPVLLLGRSGTGKTTCLTFRMWAHYKVGFRWYFD
jgi:hypothetical protein